VRAAAPSGAATLRGGAHERVAFAGLELLATAVVLLDDELRVVHANSSAEHLLATSSRALARQVFCTLFTDAQPLNAKLREAIERAWGLLGSGAHAHPAGGARCSRSIAW